MESHTVSPTYYQLVNHSSPLQTVGHLHIVLYMDLVCHSRKCRLLKVEKTSFPLTLGTDNLATTHHILKNIIICHITLGSLKNATWHNSIPFIKLTHHHYKHHGLDPLIRSVSRVTAARANASSVFQLFSFLVVCSGMISKGFGFVALFASVKASSVSIHLSCLVCL